ncbi:ComF family protein [Alphaproteobacteria bacterium]|nr:ComF family protein [Alphaproteobacteria bacterium]
MVKVINKLTLKSSDRNIILDPICTHLAHNFSAEKISQLLKLIFPALCASCDTYIYDQGLCADCWQKLEPVTEPVCYKCIRPLPYQNITGCCEGCLLTSPKIEKIVAAYRYNDISRSLILQFKYADRLELTHLLARLLMPAFKQICGTDSLVIPIPLHPSRYRERKFNQSSELARKLCSDTNINHRFQPSLLERKKNTKHLGKMPRTQRAKTVKGAFSINAKMNPYLIGKSCLLIDDVITTGSTISEATKTLLKAGASSVSAICFASTQKK